MNIVFYTVLIIIIITTSYLSSFRKVTEPFESHIKIFLINLNRNKDRLLTQINQAKRLKINLERFTAYDGQFLDPNQLITQRVLHPNNYLKRGQLGCAFSHYKLWLSLKQLKDPYAIILEDDVNIPDNFRTHWNKIYQHLPNNWDIIFLGGCNIKGKLINQYFIKPIPGNSSYNLCLHSYMINIKSIDKIIQYVVPFQRPIDSQLRDFFHRLNVYYVYPNMILQNKDIRSTRRDIDGLPQSMYWKRHQGDITLV